VNLPIPESARQLAILRAELREQAVADFGVFVRWAWPKVEPIDLVWTEAVDALCVHMQAVAEGRIQYLLINIPPGFGKSIIVSVLFPAWMWARDPTWRILCSASAIDLSTRDSLRCRDLLQDPEYRAIFADEWGVVDPERWELTGDQNAKTFYRTSKFGHRQSVGVGSKTTGKRADCVLIDDPLALLEAYSDAHRNRAWDHVSSVLPNRRNRRSRDPMVMIMQRVHELDPSAWAINQGWEHLCLPLLYEPETHCSTSIGWTDWRSTPGECLDSAGVIYDEKGIEEAKAEREFEAQYQQRPSSAKGKIVSADQFRRYRDIGDIPREAIQHGHWFQTWDMRDNGEGKTTSFAVGQVWLAYKAHRWLIDQVRGRWSTKETIAELESLCARWPQADELVVENKADGRPIMNLLAGKYSFRKHEPEGSKAQRFAAEAFSIQNGDVFIPDRFPSESQDCTAKVYLYNMAKFPTSGVPDDEVDATTMALERARSFRAIATTGYQRKSKRGASGDRLRRLSGTRMDR